jgi:hypothetical protein
VQFFALIPDDPESHNFWISRKGDEVQVELDGKRIFAGSWSSFFGNVKCLYLKIASEVFVNRDAVSGTVRDVELITPKCRIAPFIPTCVAEDRGVTFTCKHGAFAATGKFHAKEAKLQNWNWSPPSCETTDRPRSQ